MPGRPLFSIASWSPWRRVLAGAILSGLTAVLFTLAFPPYELWPLIFVGLVPMILSHHRVMPERLAGLAYGIGVGGFFAGYFGEMFAHAPLFMRMLPLYIAALAGFIGSRDRRFHLRTGYRFLVPQGAAAWVGIEMVRGLIPVLGTWGFVGYALYDQPWLLQPVSIFGVYGLNLVILLVNYSLGLCALMLFDRLCARSQSERPAEAFSGHTRFVGKGATAWVWASGAVLVIWIGLSLAIRMRHETTTTVRVAAIQPGPTLRSDEGLAILASLTREAAYDGARLIVWHEGALAFDPRVEHTQHLRSLASEIDAHLVIGYVAPNGRSVRNESIVLTPEGEFLGPYGKDHQVAWSREKNATRGPYVAYDTDLVRLGMIICYDIDFTDTARRIARDGAQIIAVPTHDWPAVVMKHYTHAVFRAIENRVAIVKADVGFDSVIVDSLGRIVAREVQPVIRQAILVADVSIGGGRTIFSSLGDWVGWIALAAMLGFVALDLIGYRSSAGKRSR